MRHVSPCLLIGTLFLTVNTIVGFSQDKPAVPVTSHDPDLYLFIDSHWIEKQEGIERIYNQAKPLNEPVIWPDDPATETDCAWGNVIRESDGRYRMWYTTMTMGHNNAGAHEIASAGVWGRGDDFSFRPRSDADRPAEESMLGKYAESTDGVHWTKPKLGMFEYRGTTANNIVLTGHAAAKQTNGALTNFDGLTILRDDRDPDPSRRYKMIAHWESVHFWDNHPISGSLGRRQAFIDRCKEARGEYITFSSDGLRWEQPLERLPTLPTNGGDRLLVVQDHRNDRWMAYVRAGGWSYPALSYSADLMDWSEAEACHRITPDFVKAPAVECMIPFNYGNQDLGFPCGMDKPKGVFSVKLASRHGRDEWNPVDIPDSVIPNGPPGSYYATGAVPLHNEPFLVGDEMLIYFNAFSRNQEKPCPFGSRSIGVAKLRRDGFAGLRSSSSAEQATVTTKLLPVHGDELQINSELRGDHGSISIALLDESGTEMPGFTFDDSIPITSGAVRVPVRWKTSASISSLRGQSARVSLRLQGKAILYALTFAEKQAP